MRGWLGVGLCCVIASVACGSKDPEDRDGDSNESDRGRGPADAGRSPADAGDARDGGGQSGECDGRFLPIAVGNTWTYRVISPVDGVSMKVNTIDDMDVVGGSGPNASKKAFHALTTKVSTAGMDMTESWQDVLPDGSVVRYREIGYKAGTEESNGEDVWDPYKLRFDQSGEHTVAGASWTERYSETKIDAAGPITAARADGWKVDDVDVPCGPVDGEMLSCIKISKAADGADSGKTYWYAPCVGKVREQGAQVEELMSFELH